MKYQRKLIPSRLVQATDRAKLSTMGKLFVTILLIVVFEGALRKWVSEDLTNPLVLLRDGLALFGVYWAIKCGKLRFSQLGAQVLGLWTCILLLWSLLQLMVNQTSFLIFIVGIRFWLLYLWFAYAAAVSLTEGDFRYITKTILLLLLVMAPLAVVQFFLPPDAFLNKQLDDDETTVFIVIEGIVRTTGTFSFTAGYTTFLAVVTPFVLALLAPGPRLWGKKSWPAVILLAMGVATMVSGSRGALIMFGLLFLAHIFISLRFSRSAGKGDIVFMLVFSVMLLSLVPYVFSRAFDASQERFETAADSEDFTERVLSVFFGEPAAYEKLTLIGDGVGAGNNYAGMVSTGERTFLLAETEAARTILEGGLIGFAFIGLKMLVIMFGLRKSAQIAKLSGNSLPLLIWVTLAVGLLTWSIIGQLTINALGYLLLGLGIASLRLFEPQR